MRFPDSPAASRRWWLGGESTAQPPARPPPWDVVCPIPPGQRALVSSLWPFRENVALVRVTLGSPTGPSSPCVGPVLPGDADSEAYCDAAARDEVVTCPRPSDFPGASAGLRAPSLQGVIKISIVSASGCSDGRRDFCSHRPCPLHCARVLEGSGKDWGTSCPPESSGRAEAAAGPALSRLRLGRSCGRGTGPVSACGP